MVIIETGADETDFGKMICYWDEDAAVRFIRGHLEAIARRFVELHREIGASELPNETEMQSQLDKWSVTARALLEQYAPEVLSMAQDRIVIDVSVKLLQKAVEEMTLTFGSEGEESVVVPLPQIVDMEQFSDLRKQMSELFKTTHNKIIGVRRGRQAGKKDTKPRAKRAASAERRSKILAAMREIGQAPFRRGEVARRIGITTKTLGMWVSKEEWEYLSVEALSIGSQK